MSDIGGRLFCFISVLRCKVGNSITSDEPHGYKNQIGNQLASALLQIFKAILDIYSDDIC